MIISLLVIVVILWAHFIGDFILQSDYHAVNKSKDNWALFSHICYYTMPLAAAGLIIPVSLAWLAVNAVLHGVIDYVTSRITSRLWVAGKRHWFFVTIGFDQSLHFTCLFATYLFLVK